MPATGANGSSSAARLLPADAARRRDGAEVLSNANLSRSRHFAEFERGIAYLASARLFRPTTRCSGMVTVFDYALGITYEHQADIARRRTVAEKGDAVRPLTERTGKRSGNSCLRADWR